MCVCTESRLFFFLSSSLNETNTRSQFIYSGSEAVLDWPLLSKPSCEAVCMEVAVLIMSIFIAFWPSHEPKLNCGQKIDTKSSKHFFKTVLHFLFGFFFFMLQASQVQKQFCHLDLHQTLISLLGICLLHCFSAPAHLACRAGAGGLTYVLQQGALECSNPHTPESFVFLILARVR